MRIAFVIQWLQMEHGEDCPCGEGTHSFCFWEFNLWSDSELVGVSVGLLGFVLQIAIEK